MLRAQWRLLFVLWLVSLVAFSLPALMPGDPARIALLEHSQNASAENMNALNVAWGLDRSWPERYLGFLNNIAHGNWGNSLRTGRPVAEELAPRLPWSLAIGLGGLLIGALMCLPLGYAAAYRPGGFFDHATRVLVVFAQTLPAFVLAVVLAWVVSAKWHLIPIYTGSPLERVLLPMLLVAFYAAAPLTRIVRHAFLNVSTQAFMLTARAKGLSQARAMRRHAGPHVLSTLLSALVPQMAWVVGGTAVVEIVFAIPGVSQLVVESVASRDHPVLSAYIMGIALMMVAVQALAIVLRHRLDPRLTTCAA